MKKFLAVCILLVISTYALAQSTGGDFEIVSHTIDGGGGQSSGGDFSLTGSIGQHDASQTTLVGGRYIAADGFWARAVEIFFKDSFEN